jgi:hypothetical protein
LLDVVPEAGASGCALRRAMLESMMLTDAVLSGDASSPVPTGAVVMPLTLRPHGVNLIG